MHYQGPTAADLVNVRALNRMYLGVRDEWRELSVACRMRLEALPFLLFSLREHDGHYWDLVLADDAQPDMLTLPAASLQQQLQAAALGFLWQLSRQNAYAARLTSGAPPGWCERLAETTLVSLLRRAAARSDLITVRFPADGQLMQRLLLGGNRSTLQIQRLSQQLALQTMLTGGPSRKARRLAACRFRAATHHAAGQRIDTEV